MRRITLDVPSEVLGEFTEKMLELELENSIVGRTEEDEIEIEVLYEKEEAKKIDELEEHLEKLIDELEDEEEDEEDDDN